MRKFLIDSFLDAMNDIGQYGHGKYGAFSFHARREHGDTSRGDHPRTTSAVICAHGQAHLGAYLAGDLHDHFNTRKHQLAAAAFNAMLEYYFADLENEDAA